MIQAGFGRGTIRFPAEIFPLEGFCGVHDDPHVRLMVLRCEESAFALLEAELVIIPNSAIDRWRNMISGAFEIDRDHVVMQMTHAITTPHEPGPMGPPDKRPEPTEEDLRKRNIYHTVTDAAVTDAIRQAKETMSSAALGWGAGPCDVNVSCDVETPFGWWLGTNPDGYSNHTMTVLRVNSREGGMKGLLVSFGMKPAAIDNAGQKEGKRLISSEIAGVFCEKMEAVYGVPVIYSVSAGGNQIPRQTALGHGVSEDGKPFDTDEGPEAGFRYAEVQGAEMCEAAKSIVDSITCEAEAVDSAWEDCAIRWQRRRGGPRKLSKSVAHEPQGETEVTANLFRLGDTTFVMVRPELTAEVERYLLNKSPAKRTILMTLTNGEMKCLAHQEAFAQNTYESQGGLMPGAAEALMDTIIKTMEGM